MDDSSSCRVAAAGDVFLESCSGMNPFGDEIYDLLEDVDIGIVNLETPITTDGRCEEKAVSLRAEPQHVSWLNGIGRNTVVNIANNHTFDYGLLGFEDTVRYLQLSGIETVGDIENSSSQEPYCVELSCGRVAILGYSKANKVIQGIGVAGLEESQIIKDIDRARKKRADWIIVNLHWGTEYTCFPSPGQQRMARALVDAGADVVIGSHPHMVQGIERYKKGLVLYSLGNFNFCTTFDKGYPHTDWGMVVLITLSDKPMSVEVVPIKVNAEYHPELMSTDEQSEFHDYLAGISDRLRSGISHCFWLSHASVPVLRSSLRGFKARIERYGISHAVAMIKWLVHPRTYPYYLGLLLRLAGSIADDKR